MKSVLKYGKKQFAVDENRRDTYQHSLDSGHGPSVLTTLEGELKQLMAVCTRVCCFSFLYFVSLLLGKRGGGGDAFIRKNLKDLETKICNMCKCLFLNAIAKFDCCKEHEVGKFFGFVYCKDGLIATCTPKKKQ